MSVCKCQCERVLCPYGVDVCAVDFQLKHGGFDPRRVRSHTHTFLLLPFLSHRWLSTPKYVCLSR